MMILALPAFLPLTLQPTYRLKEGWAIRYVACDLLAVGCNTILKAKLSAVSNCILDSGHDAASPLHLRYIGQEKQPSAFVFGSHVRRICHLGHRYLLRRQLRICTQPCPWFSSQNPDACRRLGHANLQVKPVFLFYLFILKISWL